MKITLSELKQMVRQELRNTNASSRTSRNSRTRRLSENLLPSMSQPVEGFPEPDAVEEVHMYSQNRAISSLMRKPGATELVYELSNMLSEAGFTFKDLIELFAAAGHSDDI